MEDDRLGNELDVVETTARRLGASQTRQITVVNPGTVGPALDHTDSADEAANQRLSPTLIGVGLLIAAALVGFGLYASTRSLGEKQAAIFDALDENAARLSDSFDRPSGGTELNAEDDEGLEWSVLGPPVRLVNGEAVVVADVAASIALVDTGWSNVAVGLTVGEQATGSGLIFRSVDLANYWSLIAVPDYATWNLVLTVDGQVVSTTPTGLNSVDAGTRLSVTTSGPEIRVFVNGAPVLNLVDPSHELATNAGIVAAPGGRSAFDEFFAIDNSTAE